MRGEGRKGRGGGEGGAGEPSTRLSKISTYSLPASWRRTHLNTRLTPSAASSLLAFLATFFTTAIWGDMSGTSMATLFAMEVPLVCYVTSALLCHVVLAYVIFTTW